MNLIIREAIAEDVAQMLEIYNDVIATTTAVYEYNPHSIEMRQAWYNEKLKKNIPVFIAQVDDCVAGFASYGPFRAWPAYKYSIEHSIYVHRNFRRQGIAKMLLSELIDFAKQKEVHTIVASIDADNVSSLRLHKQFGFEETAHFKQVGYKFGKWLDLKFLQLMLVNGLEPKDG